MFDMLFVLSFSLKDHIDRIHRETFGDDQPGPERIKPWTKEVADLILGEKNGTHH